MKFSLVESDEDLIVLHNREVRENLSLDMDGALRQLREDADKHNYQWNNDYDW